MLKPRSDCLKLNDKKAPFAARKMSGCLDTKYRSATHAYQGGAFDILMRVKYRLTRDCEIGFVGGDNAV